MKTNNSLVMSLDKPHALSNRLIGDHGVQFREKGGLIAFQISSYLVEMS